jgi:hypothetical protein
LGYFSHCILDRIKKSQEDVDEEISSVVTLRGDAGVSLRRASRDTCAGSRNAADRDAVGSRAINQPGSASVTASCFRNIADGDACLNVATSDTCGGATTFDACGSSVAPDAASAGRRNAHLDGLNSRVICVE